MKTALALVAAVGLSACVNMPTPPVQITGAYVSGLNYEQFDCNQLFAEQDSLSRREAQLVAAQEQRLRSSQAQAFWWGVGQGDGIEATELAHVRGEHEAVQITIARKSCPAPNTTP